VVRAKWIAAALVAVTMADAPAYAQRAKPAGKGAVAAAKPDKKQLEADKKALADAKSHYSAGQAAYKSGSYAAALTEFQAADNIKSTPQAARMIGLCFDALGKFPEAVTAYDRFLANAPTNMTKQVDEVKKREEDIKKLPGKIHVDTDPQGATVAVDGTNMPNVTPTDVEVAPGHHKIRLTVAGHDPVERELDVTFAMRQELTVPLPSNAPPPVPVPIAAMPPAPEPAPPPEPPPPAAAPAEVPPEQHPSSKVPAYITGGLAIVAAGVGTAFGVMALSDKSDFDSNPTASKADDGENHALIADMSFGVALTLGITSAVLFFSGSDQSAPAPEPSKSALKVTPTPIVTQNGAGAGALVRF
jgi:hypothetical protein